MSVRAHSQLQLQPGGFFGPRSFGCTQFYGRKQFSQRFVKFSPGQRGAAKAFKDDGRRLPVTGAAATVACCWINTLHLLQHLQL